MQVEVFSLHVKNFFPKDLCICNALSLTCHSNNVYVASHLYLQYPQEFDLAVSAGVAPCHKSWPWSLVSDPAYGHCLANF